MSERKDRPDRENRYHNIREILREVNSIRNFGAGTAYNDYVDKIIAFFPEERNLLLAMAALAVEDKIEEARKHSDKRVKFVARQLIKIYKRRIEEAKREERKRIIGLLPEITTRFDHNKTCFDCVENIKRQALKGE